jgi:hypothetical protein
MKRRAKRSYGRNQALRRHGAAPIAPRRDAFGYGSLREPRWVRLATITVEPRSVGAGGHFSWGCPNQHRARSWRRIWLHQGAAR